jgi:hypothetical protein
MKESVKYVDFWPADDVTKEFIKNLVVDALPAGTDAIVTSVFTYTSLFRKLTESLKIKLNIDLPLDVMQRRLYNLASVRISKEYRNIWYTGENLRPPSTFGWDALLSFEIDETIDKNIYLPLWATRFGRNIQQSEDRQHTFSRPRTVLPTQRKFACAIIGNPEPHRMRVIQEIAKIGKIDLYGKVFDKPVANKHQILLKYDFNLCFENDLYPGYVTEKVFEAWEAECIPLWWGSDPLGYINQDALVNFAQGNLKNRIEYVAKIKQDPKLVNKMKQKPILATTYDYQTLLKKLKTLLVNED